MQQPPSYRDPPEFLEALAKRLHTRPDRVPSAQATEELLRWLEETAARGRTPPVSFLRVALRLVYEQTRLALGPGPGEVFALADRLKAENRNRPQAQGWQGADWLKLARLLLAQRRLPLVALFREDPPRPSAVLQQIPLPYFARHVEEPLRPNAQRIPAAPLDGLFERAERLLLLAATDVDDAQKQLYPLRSLPRKRAPQNT